MKKNVIYKEFIGKYREQYANGKDHLHTGIYELEILKTRVNISFKPFNYEMPLFIKFCVLGNEENARKWINDNWQ